MKKLILIICISFFSCQDSCKNITERIGESYLFRGDTLLVIEWETWTTYRVLNLNKNDTQTYSVHLFDKLKKVK